MTPKNNDQTQLRLPEDTMERLRELRAYTQVPMARLIRNALDRYLDEIDEQRKTVKEPWRLKLR